MEPTSDLDFVQKTVSRNYCKFYPVWKRNNFKSAAQGVEVGDYVDMVMIISPGQNKDEWHGKVNEDHKREFPEQWRAYKEGKEQRLSGTPVELLPGMVAGRADVYKAHYVHTIEQLADLSDLAKQKLGMGTGDDVKKAREFLQKGSGDVLILKAENEALKVQSTALQAQLTALSEQVAALTAKPKRGRPRKVNGDAEARQ